MRAKHYDAEPYGAGHCDAKHYDAQHYDAILTGGGAAGLSLAYQRRSWGQGTIVLSRKSGGSSR